MRLLFGYILPPLLEYWWHNGVYYHLAQDDKPVYERTVCLGRNVSYGPHPRETVDILIPGPHKNVGGNGETWALVFEAVVTDVVDFILAYPRAFYYKGQEALFGRRTQAPHELKEALAFDPVLFIHGGGWCAVDPGIQHHQVTAFCRHNYAVYCIAYPWAPEDPYPAALISTLRSISWVKVGGVLGICL